MSLWVITGHDGIPGDFRPTPKAHIIRACADPAVSSADQPHAEAARKILAALLAVVPDVDRDLPVVADLFP
jgi:hypothetical protein